MEKKYSTLDQGVDDSSDGRTAGDRHIPLQTLRNIVKEVLRKKYGKESTWIVKKEFVEAIHNCTIEFIDMITSEVVSSAERSSKKLHAVTPEHLTKALRALEFETIAKTTEKRFKVVEIQDRKKKSRRRKRKHSSLLTEEELIEKQRKMLEEARKVTSSS